MVRSIELHPALRGPIDVKSKQVGLEHPRALLRVLPDQPGRLLGLANRHVVSAMQFERDTLLQLFRLAAMIEIQPSLQHLPLSGKILITAFYEPSTRTRLSFESAWHRLGGDILSITDPATTGMAKGESLRDIAEMFSNYGDAVVLRDTDERSVYEMIETLRVPILNAGNGIDEHPTQALADLYTLFKWRPALCSEDDASRVRIGIIGNPSKMRTVRSLLILLSLFYDRIDEVVIVNPSRDLFDEGQRELLESRGLRIRAEHQLRGVLPELDVVYINSIAWIGDTFERLTGDMGLSADSGLRPDAIVLHPLARGEELDESLDDTDHNWYFSQARGATFVRMALLTSMVERVHRVADVRPPS
ncbi:MAG: aspartate carbamoyltransferase [Planctomycetes bacterium]|nr:aspartate carbamoyltransferase [Planctomycetota bacterium]